MKETPISDLPGCGPATAEKLAEAGFTTTMSIATATPGILSDAAGIGEASARKMINAARDASNLGFFTGEEAMEKRSKVMRISTGSEKFDALLGGGFETGSITECYGEFGSSKTQIAHILAVQVHKQNPTSIAVYIDSENSFRPERIKQLAEGAGLDPQKVLKNILVARAYNSDHQMLLAEKAAEMANEKDIQLVIVDSLTAHLRSEMIGRGELAPRQQKLNKHMSCLAKLADIHNLCVYVTNQVMADPAQFFGDPTKSVGGHIVAHSSKTRIYLRKGKKGSRVAKLVDSPHLEDGEVAFFIEEGGLKDI